MFDVGFGADEMFVAYVPCDWSLWHGFGLQKPTNIAGE
jgi:hypothetical protein